MKKALLIVGSIAALLIGAVVALAYYAIGQKDLELNRKRTEKARETKLGLSRELVEPKQEENEQVAS